MDFLDDLGNGEIFDTLGNHSGSVNTVGNQLHINDSMGNFNGSIQNFGNNSAIMHDQLGNMVGKISTFGDQVQVHNSMGGLVETISKSGNQFQTRDALGALKSSYDPLSGNISNALGNITGIFKKG